MPERDINVRVRLRGADQFMRGMKGVQSSMGWLDVTKGILGSRVIQEGLRMLVQGFNEAVDQSVAFESAVRSLQKTSGITDTALQNMAMQIMDLSERVPMTSTEIANLADTVAHLGLDQNQILPFVEVMIALGTATDMTAEEAATALAQMANVMHTTTKDYERLGSTVFELGRTSATTESQIVDMAHGMSGVGALVGMGEADVLAYAAALASIGTQAQSGATSVQKLAMQFEMSAAAGAEGMEKWAEIAGMTGQEMVTAWYEDPAMALAAFIRGLGDINESGGSAVETLSALGFEEVRLIRNVSGLAAAGDLLDRSLENGRRAWEENTTLAEATGIAYGTTASRMQMAQNAIENAQIAVGDGMKGLKLSVMEFTASGAQALRDMIMDNSLPTQLNDIKQRYDEMGQQIGNARDQAYGLISAVKELGDPENLDTAGLERYEANMNALVRIMPGVRTIYDSTTHSIKGGVDALTEFVDGQYELANSTNELNRSAEQLEAYTAKQEQLGQLQEELALASVELADAQNDLWAMPAGSEGWAETYNRADEAQKKYNELSAAVDECTEYLSQYSYITDNAVTASENVAEAMEAASEAAAQEDTSVQRLMNGLSIYDTMAQELRDEYSAALEDAREKVNSIFSDPFGGKKMPKRQSAKDTMKNLDEQLKFAEKYTENLRKAKELGLNDDALAALADGSDESFAILEGAVKNNGKSIDELNEKYASVQAAKEQMAQAMAEAQTDVADRAQQITDAVDAMVENADQAATAEEGTKATMDGLIAGIDAKLASLKTKVKQVTDETDKLAGGGSGDGSHASGLSYVPRDNYVAMLHRGEMVLTALEAKAYRAEQFTNYRMAPGQIYNDNRSTRSANVTNNFNFGDVYTRSEADLDRLNRDLSRLIEQDNRLIGIMR